MQFIGEFRITLWCNTDIDVYYHIGSFKIVLPPSKTFSYKSCERGGEKNVSRNIEGNIRSTRTGFFTAILKLSRIVSVRATIASRVTSSHMANGWIANVITRRICYLQHRRGRPVERDEGDHNAAQRHVLHRREPKAIYGVQLPSGGDKCFRAQQAQPGVLLHGDPSWE